MSVPGGRSGSRSGNRGARPQAEGRAHAARVRSPAQQLRLRAAAHGQADRVPRIRRALAVRVRDQPDGRARAGPGARHPAAGTRRQAGTRDRPRFSRLFVIHQIRPGVGPDGGRRDRARHRHGAVAHGVFRPVRARRAGGRHGHGLPQRQRLDGRQDGGLPPRDVRARRDGPPARHRAGRARQDHGGRFLPVRRELRRRLLQGPDRPAQDHPQAQGGGGLRQRHRGRLRAAHPRSARLRGRAARHGSGLHLPALQPQPRGPPHAGGHGREGA